MSSRPHHTQRTEKPSTSERRAAAEASDFNFCPHCGGPLEGTLAEHMGRGACDEHTSPERSPPPTPDEPEITPPLLEEHDEREHPDDDLDERRALADELAEKGVWTGEPGASGD
jgi:hypothetical protein